MLLRRARATAVRDAGSRPAAARRRLRPGAVGLERGRVGVASAILGRGAETCSAPSPAAARRDSATPRPAAARAEVVASRPLGEPCCS